MTCQSTFKPALSGTGHAHMSNQEDHALLQALLLISTAAAAKDKAAKEAAFKVLACCVLRYKQLEHLVAALSDMLNKDEYMSGVCAELAEYTAKHIGNNQLVTPAHAFVSYCSPRPCIAPLL